MCTTVAMAMIAMYMAVCMHICHISLDGGHVQARKTTSNDARHNDDNEHADDDDDASDHDHENDRRDGHHDASDVEDIDHSNDDNDDHDDDEHVRVDVAASHGSHGDRGDVPLLASVPAAIARAGAGITRTSNNNNIPANNNTGKRTHVIHDMTHDEFVMIMRTRSASVSDARPATDGNHNCSDNIGRTSTATAGAGRTRVHYITSFHCNIIASMDVYDM